MHRKPPNSPNSKKHLIDTKNENPWVPPPPTASRDFLLAAPPADVHGWLTGRQAGHQAHFSFQELVVHLGGAERRALWKADERVSVVNHSSSAPRPLPVSHISWIVHPFIHTCMHPRRCQPRKATTNTSGVIRSPRRQPALISACPPVRSHRERISAQRSSRPGVRCRTRSGRCRRPRPAAWPCG